MSDASDTGIKIAIQFGRFKTSAYFNPPPPPLRSPSQAPKYKSSHTHTHTHKQTGRIQTKRRRGKRKTKTKQKGGGGGGGGERKREKNEEKKNEKKDQTEATCPNRPLCLSTPINHHHKTCIRTTTRDKPRPVLVLTNDSPWS